MENAQLKEQIYAVLKTDDRVWNKDKTEMADTKYGISVEDQRLTRQFYNSEE